jgi:hypothetical protein
MIALYRCYLSVITSICINSIKTNLFLIFVIHFYFTDTDKFYDFVWHKYSRHCAKLSNIQNRADIGSIFEYCMGRSGHHHALAHLPYPLEPTG